MIYLLLAILSSTLIPIIFKIAHNKKVNEPIVITTNYLTISIIMLLITLRNGLLEKFFSNIRIEFSNPYFLTLAIGVISGYFFYISFYYYQKSVRQCGATLAGAFGKMGILIPAVLSLVIWKEFPSNIQWIGILLAVVAIVIMMFDFKNMKLNQLHKVLIVFLILGGLGDFSTKVFQVYSDVKIKEIYLLITFFSAMIFSLSQSIKGGGVKKWDVILGSLIGVPNVLASYFLILALAELVAVIVFPIFSGGTVVLVALLSLIIFRERLVLKQYIGIGLMIISLIIIS